MKTINFDVIRETEETKVFEALGLGKEVDLIRKAVVLHSQKLAKIDEEITNIERKKNSLAIFGETIEDIRKREEYKKQIEELQKKKAECVLEHDKEYVAAVGLFIKKYNAKVLPALTEDATRNKDMFKALQKEITEKKEEAVKTSRKNSDLCRKFDGALKNLFGQDLLIRCGIDPAPLLYDYNPVKQMECVETLYEINEKKAY